MRKLLFLLLLTPMPLKALDITITIDDQIKDRVLESFCAHYDYQELIRDDQKRTIPNPVSKQEFMQKYITNLIKGIVVSEEAKKASDKAREDTLKKSDGEIS